MGRSPKLLHPGAQPRTTAALLSTPASCRFSAALKLPGIEEMAVDLGGSERHARRRRAQTRARVNRPWLRVGYDGGMMVKWLMNDG